MSDVFYDELVAELGVVAYPNGDFGLQNQLAYPRANFSPNFARKKLRHFRQRMWLALQWIFTMPKWVDGVMQ